MTNVTTLSLVICIIWNFSLLIGNVWMKIQSCPVFPVVSVVMTIVREVRA